MQPNPVLKKLGFSDDDRVLIIHTDDIGMCQASVTAYADLDRAGVISSGAVMVPCPWFPAAAAYAREHPETDLGVHLTLTSEWDTYRWGPISTRDPASGLLDEEGYLHRESAGVQEAGDPTAVQRELEAQVERALAAGMAPTHIDTHMGAVAHIKFIPAYIQTALKYRLPMMMFRLDRAGWEEVGLEGEAAEMAVGMVAELEGMGMPLLDHLIQMELDAPEGRTEQVVAAFAGLKPGITHFIIHPSKDTAELRAITPDWPSRVADYETFMQEALRDTIREMGIQVIGYRAIQGLMPV
jgi:predicted glycoside hydrolase/deacetylase ChbG (UPF0249 family)